VLTTFKLNLKKRTTGHGKKLKSLLTTPKCPKSKRWTSVTKFNYDDGTSKKITTHQKCKK